jgi:hypothetical protein
MSRAAIALCRATLEQCLAVRVEPAESARQKGRHREISLQSLIHTALRKGLLTLSDAHTAHEIRMAGNRALHPNGSSAADAQEVLKQTRILLGRLFPE